MDLNTVHFRYDLPSKSFKSINYSFDPIISQLNKKSGSEELINQIKTSIQELENIIIINFKNKFEKKETGEIDSYSITKGYEYKEKFNILKPSNYFNSITLDYTIQLDYSTGAPTSIKIGLRNSNEKKLMDIHDQVLVIPDLKFSDNAKRHLDNIEYLRHQKFDASKYLLLK